MCVSVRGKGEGDTCVSEAQASGHNTGGRATSEKTKTPTGTCDLHGPPLQHEGVSVGSGGLSEYTNKGVKQKVVCKLLVEGRGGGGVRDTIRTLTLLSVTRFLSVSSVSSFLFVSVIPSHLSILRGQVFYSVSVR